MSRFSVSAITIPFPEAVGGFAPATVPSAQRRVLKVPEAYRVLYGSPGTKVYVPELVGRMAARAFFLVDKQGIVRAKWFGDGKAIFPSEVLLQAAQQVAEKP